jgi:hypothetical protein
MHLVAFAVLIARLTAQPRQPAMILRHLYAVITDGQLGGDEGLCSGRWRGSAQDERDGDDVVVLIQGRPEVTSLSMTNQVLVLRDHLVAERVTCVVMEATGDC